MMSPPPKVAGTYRKSDSSAKRERLGSGYDVYFKLPQKRWMRRQASSRSSVLVA